MKIKPLHDNVLVKRLEAEEKSRGGIIIPESAKESPDQGTVIAAGPGRTDEQGHVTPLQVKKGDRVIFSKYAGTEVKIEGEEHLILKEDQILGVVEGKPQPA